MPKNKRFANYSFYLIFSNKNHIFFYLFCSGKTGVKKIFLIVNIFVDLYILSAFSVGIYA